MKKKQQRVKISKNKVLFFIFLGAVVFSCLFFVVGVVHSVVQPDKQCLISHETSSKPPADLKTAKDYFDLANYNYDRGDCKQAIINYSLAIDKDPQSAESYNNRAYTYMRLQNYQAALSDLNKALELRPDYVNALMNRGDIYNYYYNIDRQKAMEDYNRVLKLVPVDKYRSLSLCGHRLLAQNNGWNIAVFTTLLTKGYNAGCN